jgi:ribosomal protein L11 methyltransferase
VLGLVVTVPAVDAELASDLLWSLGVLAVEERDAGPVGLDDHLVELWTSLGDDAEEITRAASAFPARWRWHLVELDESVADTWRAHAVPTWVTDHLVVVPAWVAFDAPPDALAIMVEPGSSFGMGDHPTTVLCLRAIVESVRPGRSVLDVGCGSGVLGIAAARLGASRVESVDISAAAVAATQDNARRNGVDSTVAASRRPVAEVDGPFDLVVANILAPTLIELAPELRRVLGEDGLLVVSGVLSGRTEQVTQALAPLTERIRHERDGWVAITLTH